MLEGKGQLQQLGPEIRPRYGLLYHGRVIHAALSLTQHCYGLAVYTAQHTKDTDKTSQ